jgi:hypothetical protein
MKYTVKDNQEQAVRDLEIDPALFTPKDQIRPWVREWPQDVKPEKLMPQPARRSQA